jgi:peptide/nickel transport system substrate-binding protein
MRVWPLLGAVLVAGCFERGSASSRDELAPPSDAAPAATAAPIDRPDEPDRPADPDATIRVRLEAEPAHLNPLVAGEAVALRITVGDLYEGLLCRLRAGAEPTPCLAETVEVEDGGRRVRATLRDRVSWHDGEPFGADDVVFTYQLLIPPARIASWLAPAVDDLVAVRAVDPRTVELVFRGPGAGRRGLLADVPIVPRHIFQPVADRMATAEANRTPVGTGPLAFAGWSSGSEIELERYPGYWGEPARAARIVYRIIPSRTRALAALADGAVDLAPQLPVDEAVAAADGDGALQAYGYRNPAYLAAVYNLRRPPLASASRRRALTMLLDRATVVRELLGGYGQVISGPMMPGTAASDDEVAPLPFDRSAAAELFESPPRLSLAVPTESRTMARVADIWAADARGAVRLVVDRVPYVELLGRVRAGEFDIALLAFSTDRDPDLYGRFHSSQIGVENYGGLADAELDELLERARREPDAAARAALQRAIHRRLHALQPYGFIATDARAGVARRDIGGLADGAGFAARRLWRAR